MTVGVVSMEEPKRKLRGTYSSEPYMQDFKSLLADRLKERHDPLNVLLAVNLLVTDLKKGTDGWTGKPIVDGSGHVPKIVGLDHSMYSLLGSMLVRNSEEYFGEDFAEEMKREWREVSAEASSLAALLR